MYYYFITCLSKALEAHKDVLNKKTCRLVIMCARGHVTKSCDAAPQTTTKFTKTMRASGSVGVLDIKII